MRKNAGENYEPINVHIKYVREQEAVGFLAEKTKSDSDYKTLITTYNQSKNPK